MNKDKIDNRLKEYEQGLEQAKAQVQRYIGAIAVLKELNVELEDKDDNPIE